MAQCWQSSQTFSHTLDCFPHPWHIQSVWAIGMLSQGYGCTLTPLHSPSWLEILNFCTCEVEMMSSHYGWRWHPPQKDHIHIIHVQCIWGIRIGVLSQGHIGAPSYPSTGQISPRLWSFRTVWSGNDAITSWLRLIPTSDCFPHPY